LEDQIHHERTLAPAVIHFETNQKLKGLEFIEPIYHAIIQQQALRIDYQGFKASKAQEFVFHALLLKEFRNRWFVLGRTKNFESFTLLALDRIHSLAPAPEVAYRDMPEFDGEAYFGDIIGVTKHEGEAAQTVRLRFSPEHAPYVLTKPLHDSQLLEEELEEGGAIITLSIRQNFELERDILGYGEGVEVLEPDRLRRRIKSRLHKLNGIYDLGKEKGKSEEPT
jgi:predicted DNA-binding transcriptional regulator YafY